MRKKRQIAPVQQERPGIRVRATGPTPVAAPIPFAPKPLPIDLVAAPERPRSILEALPFTELEITCTCIRREGDQTRVSERSLRLEDGLVETRSIEGLVDSQACNKLQQEWAYETLAYLFSGLLGPTKN